ncbi:MULTISPECIES: hypothetical protein [Bacillus]|uniref:hypothetical protein n=1 Tax=Bacillus TaxID=1386 RepID=UPI000BB8C806|nr:MULTISPECIES: hypothetical protein [Bacillus]
MLIGLLQKEWKMSKPKLYQALMIVIGLWIISIGIAKYFNEVEITFAVLSLIIGAHFVIMSVHLINNLVTESKSHLWLHNPSSMYLLLGSKFILGLFFTLITIVCTSVLFLINFQIFGDDLQSSVLDFMKFIGGIVLNSVYFSVWAVFVWACIQCLTRRGLESLRNNIGFAFLIVGLLFSHIYISTTAFFQDYLASFIPSPFTTFHVFYSNDEEGILFQTGTMSMSLGIILFFGFVCVVVFYATCWMLENKRNG